MTRKTTKKTSASRKVAPKAGATEASTSPKAATASSAQAKPAKKPLRSSTRAVAKTPTTAAKATSAPAKSLAPGPVAGAAISKSDLVDRLMAQTAMKKGDARRALEATLSVLRDAISEGGEITAAPLGKIKVARQKDTNNGTLAVCRIKLKPAPSTADLPLASAKKGD